MFRSEWRPESGVRDAIFIEHCQSYALTNIFMKEKELIVLKGHQKVYNLLSITE